MNSTLSHLINIYQLLKDPGTMLGCRDTIVNKYKHSPCLQRIYSLVSEKDIHEKNKTKQNKAQRSRNTL